MDYRQAGRGWLIEIPIGVRFGLVVVFEVWSIIIHPNPGSLSALDIQTLGILRGVWSGLIS
jgi:hypothetical protein